MRADEDPGTGVFLIAARAQALASWVRRARDTRGKRMFEAISARRFAGSTDAMMMVQRSKTVPPLFIGRWTPKILFSLHERPHRHGQLRRRLGSVSQRMLTRTLRNLETTGLIARRVIRSRAVAVEYSLTEMGRTIIAPLGGMCRWAERYRKDVTAELRLTRARRTNAE